MGSRDGDDRSKTAKARVKKRKKQRIEQLLETIKSSNELSKEKLRLIELNCESGASLWLTTLPIAEEGYQLDKQSFWDLIRVRYGYHLQRLPERCPCGSRFNIQHALSCKKGGFVTQRHNALRDVTARLMTEVCTDVKVEPPLKELTGERLRERSANITPEARLDVSARDFWVTHQRAFFDIRVFNPTASRYTDFEVQKCYVINEREKKKHYNERVMRVEHGTFSPMVFSAFGGMARECSMVVKRLTELLADKRKTHVSLVSSWVRRKIIISLMKSLVYCIRGTRHPWYRDDRLGSACIKDIDASELISSIV